MKCKIKSKGGAKMRIKVDMAVEKMPVAYNTMFISAIKEAIKASDSVYYEKLYFYEGKNNKQTKNLTFSVKLSDYKITGEEFEVKGRASLVVSTPDLELGLILYNGLIHKRKFVYKNYEWTRLRVDLLKERNINKEEVIFRTLSPVCMRSKTGEFIGPEDAGYEKELNYITNEILKSYRGQGLGRLLKFKAIDLKKVVVKETLRDFIQKTGRPYLGVNAYRGIFSLTGDKEDLMAIYQLGLGFKRSQGFGNLDVVE